ncbi:hypothetical protein HK101_002411, partial [Irineochytrium annulatum]
LQGDRMIMSPIALEEILAAAGASPLPSPLLFELVNFTNRVKVHGSVREFTASDPGSVLVGDAIADGLGLPKVDLDADTDDTAAASAGEIDSMDEDDSPLPLQPPPRRSPPPAATVRLVALPKCEYLRLAPLESTYLEIQDIRATLESHLRQNYATITSGDTLVLQTRRAGSTRPTVNRFLITEVKPAPACSCIDVDVNLDVAPLDEGLAREAVERKLFGSPAVKASAVNGSGIGEGSTGGGDASARKVVEDGELEVFDLPLTAVSGSSEVEGQRSGIVTAEMYVCYRVRVTPLTRYLIATVTPRTGDADLFVSTIVERPTLIDNSYSNVDQGVSRIHFSVDGDPADNPFIYLAVRGFAPSSDYILSVATTPDAPPPQPENAMPSAGPDDAEPPPDAERCPNCQVWIAKRTIAMHSAFCARNNAVCPQCRDMGRPFVMKKTEVANHWHCTECWKVGDISERDKHMQLIHTPLPCECGAYFPPPELARHRATDCPERLILCRFCHLRVRAGPRSFASQDLLLGVPVSEHESACGSRTIRCTKCGQNVRLKDVALHAKMHDYQRKSQPPPLTCANVCCGALLRGPAAGANAMGLCQACFGPFWMAREDPGNKKLMGKLLAAYHGQLTRGCGKAYCSNKYCATSSNTELVSSSMNPNEGAIQALALLKESSLYKPGSPKYHLCVLDEKTARRREAAGRLAEMGYLPSWCVRALVESGDRESEAVDWLMKNAPRVDER